VSTPDLRPPEDAHFREVLGHYPTGVAVVTAMGADGPVGMAVNSFTSLSLTPPLVLFCPAASSTTWPVLRQCGRVAINVLSAGQEAVSRAFARRDIDRFAAMEWVPGQNEAPLLLDALGWLECTVSDEHPGGDHTIVTARVDRIGLHSEMDGALVFFRGGYDARHHNGNRAPGDG
jgi:3-hydroxy-9,10-secoandrosta-1,3,5(10)-triene-9,17-dione monooxygenase reductase component